MTQSILPTVTTLDSYRPLYRQEGVWLAAMRAICARHGLDATSLSFAPPGSNVVFWAEGNKVIKLFAPLWKEDAAKESGWLNAIAGRTGFHSPEVIAQGEIDDWPYLVLSRVPGSPLDEIWSSLVPADRERIATSLGDCLAGLHGVPIAPDPDQLASWRRFLDTQIETCASRQEALGTSSAWVSDISQFLASLSIPPSSDLVLVNGDLNPEHLFCERTSRGWQVSGMIDFGDAMIANPCYDFVRPGFILRGSRLLRRRMLRAYGFTENDFTTALTRELFTYVLVHQFANIPETLSEYKSNPPGCLDALISDLWGF